MYNLSFNLIVFYFFLSFLTNAVEAQGIKSPAADFRRHRLVHPVLHHGRTKREITSTRHTNWQTPPLGGPTISKESLDTSGTRPWRVEIPSRDLCPAVDVYRLITTNHKLSQKGLHHPEVTMTLSIDGVEHILDLVLNDDLVARGHTITYQKDGSMVTYKPSVEELDICQYSGTVRGSKGSWVALSTCHGVRGVIHDGENMRYIEPAEVVGTEIGSKHFVYDHSDLTTRSSYGYRDGIKNSSNDYPEHLKGNSSEQRKEWRRFNRYKRDTSEDMEVRGPFNVNQQSRYVELVLVADNGEYRANGESIHTVHRQLKDVTNIINSLYAPLNIFIALVGVEIWTERDRIRLMDDAGETLRNFLKYRKDILNNRIANDNAQLLTLHKFQHDIVENSLTRTICTAKYSGGVALNYSEIVGLVATTMAHGLGHNLGMEDDVEPECACPDENCIMSPYVRSVAPTHWSNCSRQELALAFERGMDHCLRNKPKRLFDSPTCGNGFVEPGEQCDCGLRPDAACAACCDPLACVLRSNATCASGECCDPLTCQPKSAGTVCRSAERECDLPEYCTGHSEFCPKDVHKMDATPCSNDQAYCVRGACRTHADQCRLLWGSTGLNADAKCYDINRKGDGHGNCGYNRSTAQYQPCAPEDALCGLLQCGQLSDRLEYGHETIAVLNVAILNTNGSYVTCRTAMVDLGTQDGDPGMVPDGARCGEDKMCLNQKCVSVKGLRAAEEGPRQSRN